MGKYRYGTKAALDRRMSVEFAELASKNGEKFDLRLTAGERSLLAAESGVSSIAKLRFAGEIKSVPPADWLLRAKLGATVVQPCVLSLAPVRTRIESSVERRYSPKNFAPAPGSCVPMPDDENIEPITDEIDLLALIRESLVLELPLYPKQEGASLISGESLSEVGNKELFTPEKPFAVLSEFRKQLDR